jgi:hypothetical protein
VPRRLEIYVLLTSVCVALAIGEVVVRVAVRQPPRSMVMISSPHILLDQRGAVRHIPNEKVRMVSIAEDTIEFDVSFQTNNLGFVDHRDYPVGANSRSHYAFVGDSFGYGMGAEPWVPKLRDTLRGRGQDLEIYNLGVNGASIRHFQRLLSSVAAELPLTHIVLIAISNDFYRPWWVPIESPEGLRACLDPPDCGNLRPPSPVIDYDETASALLARHRKLEAALARDQPVVDPLWKRALWRSQLYLLVRRGVRQVYQRFVPREPDRNPNDLENPSLLAPNLEALAGIRREFPELPITLAHFPQIDEVRTGRYDLELLQAASELGIDYFPALTRCSWSLEMYHAVNAHPNSVGYGNFAHCLSQHLLMSQ